MSSDIIKPKCGGSPYYYDDLGRITIVDGTEVPVSKAWPTKVDQWRDLIAKYAKQTGMPEAWIAGFMAQESGGNPKACSPCQSSCCSSYGCCAHGLMQFIEPVMKKYGVTDPYDPEQSINAGARLLRQLADKYAWDIAACAASYNAGGVYCKDADTSRWHVRQNAGYVDGVIKHTNNAIMNHGYSGIASDPTVPIHGANDDESGSMSDVVKGILVLSGVVIVGSAVYYVNTKTDWRRELGAAA